MLFTFDNLTARGLGGDATQLQFLLPFSSKDALKANLYCLKAQKRTGKDRDAIKYLNSDWPFQARMC